MAAGDLTYASPLDAVPTDAVRGRPNVGRDPKKRDGTGRRKPEIEEVRARGFDTGTYEACALIDPNKPLTQLQKDFVRYWAQGETILSASHKAGYSDNGTFAYRLARMPNILKLYNEEKRLYEEAAQMSRKKVMDMLLEAYDAAKMVNEPSSMVAAAREIGKMCGYYEPVKVKVDVNVAGKVIHERLEALSDGELLEILTNGQAPQLLEAPNAG